MLSGRVLAFHVQNLDSVPGTAKDQFMSFLFFFSPGWLRTYCVYQTDLSLLLCNNHIANKNICSVEIKSPFKNYSL